MPSKIKPTAVRFDEERLAKIEACAAKEGLSRHAMILRMVDAYDPMSIFSTSNEEQKSYAAPDIGKPISPKATLARAEKKAVAQPPPKRPRSSWLKGVQLGPTAPPPGSMLKGTAKPKGKR